MTLSHFRQESLPRPLLTLILLLLVAGIWATPVSAQRNATDIPVVTRAIALEGVRIVQAPGRIIENGTVLIRNGRIEAVGETVTIPYDAERIAPDSMTVYAAFVDGLSTTGVPEPSAETNLPAIRDPGNPPDDRAGIEPQRDVREMLSADEDAIDELRGAGFGTAHVVPIGRMLPGSGAIVLLGGADRRAMVLKGDASMFVQFQGARGVYPGTPMAIMAKFRQLYTEAKRRQLLEERFAANPASAARPEFNEVYYAFFPVLDGDKPAFFYADDALEIHRALQLQSDLGFRLMLAGVGEGFDTVEALAEADVPLFLTLDLPDKPRWMSKLKKDSVETILASFTPDTRTATFRDVEAERRNLEARQLISRDKYVGVASALHDAGVRFGFSTRSADADDIRGNIRDMIEQGLSEDAALAALTTDAAAQLGISDILGTVDPGKIANLIIADGPLFDEDTQYQYVFVDGQKYVYEKAARDTTQADSGGDTVLSGTWTFTAFTPDGEQSGETTFTRRGDGWTGIMIYDGGAGSFPLSRIRLDGRSLSFSWTDPNSGEMSVEGSISGDEFDGAFVVAGQSMPVTGVRTSSPQ